MLEQIGKSVNYNIRSFYLAENTELKKAIVNDIERLNVLQTGSDEFFVLEIEEEKATKGLLIDYFRQDFNKEYDEKIILISGKTLQIQDLSGKGVVIERSKKYPSFFRIVALN